MVNLIKLLRNSKASEIICFFMDNPTLKISQIDIIRKLKIAKGTAVKWMKLLVKDNIFKIEKIGVTNLYSLNNDMIQVKELKRNYMLNKVIDVMNIPQDKEIELYMYGSVARGEYNENSDVDLLMIGNIKRDAVIETIEKLSKKIKKKISIKIFTQLEYAMLEKKDKAYYYRIEKDKIRLI